MRQCTPFKSSSLLATLSEGAGQAGKMTLASSAQPCLSSSGVPFRTLRPPDSSSSFNQDSVYGMIQALRSNQTVTREYPDNLWNFRNLGDTK